jgi:membrane-associated phospholipid phosphatase
VLRRSCALVAAIALTATSARADEPVTPRIEIRHDLRVDLPVTAGLTVVVVGWRLTRDDLEPATCRWCDDHLNAVDDWFRTALVRRDTQPANTTSYALAFGAAPLSAAALTILAAVADRRGDEAFVDVIVVAEGGLSAMLVTEILEPIALRMRPYVRAIPNDDERARVIAETGAFHSFPAGHVVEAFGVATSAGVVASMRGYRLAPLVWASGMMIGAATAYTRIAADRHYFTDTLAGAAIGTTVGAAVPLLFHGRKGPTPMAMPLPGGGIIAVGATF